MSKEPSDLPSYLYSAFELLHDDYFSCLPYLSALNSSQEKLGWKVPKISKSGIYGTSQVALIWRRILFHKGDFTKSFLLLAFGLCGLTSHTVQVDDCAWRYAVDTVGLV